jgi:hypothetical protein
VKARNGDRIECSSSAVIERATEIDVDSNVFRKHHGLGGTRESTGRQVQVKRKVQLPGWYHVQLFARARLDYFLEKHTSFHLLEHAWTYFQQELLIDGNHGQTRTIPIRAIIAIKGT